MSQFYDQDEAQYEAQAIIDSVDRCARGDHSWELLYDIDGGDVFRCEFCQVTR